jgi:hypothetical protein
MPQQRCVVCDRAGPDRQELENEETGERAHVCWECLRSRLRAKADASDPRARRLLARDADRFDWQVWSTETVVYLLPRLDDEAGQGRVDEAEPMVDVTHG